MGRRVDWKLTRHQTQAGLPGPVVACVMDGVGIGARDGSDAVWLARTPHLDWLASNALATELRAHGKSVGMPSDADMGNSEVGHNALGAGRIFDQGAKLVAQAIADGRLYVDDAWQKLTRRVRQSGQPIHFIGLLSDGNVHSHIDHLIAMIRRCDEEEVGALRVHALLDGRDVPERSALGYIDALEELLETLRRKGRDYRVASGGGRMLVTMDRYEADWRIVERGWKAHVQGDARAFRSAREAVLTVPDANKPAQVCVDPKPALLAKWDFRLPPAMLVRSAREGPTLAARLHAVAGLTSADREDARAVLRSILLDGSEAKGLRKQAADVLGSMQSVAARDILLQALARGQTVADHGVRTAAVSALGSRTRARARGLRTPRRTPSGRPHRRAIPRRRPGGRPATR